MKQRKMKVGDVFEILLSNGQRAYGQYVHEDKRMGPLIQVLDLVTEESVQADQLMDQLEQAEPLFPPVITGLFAAIRTGFWKVVAHLPVDRFVYPGFVSVMHENYKQCGLWHLWDGKRWIRLGRDLPEEYKQLEFLIVWDPHDIPHRIETGWNPYDKLIQGNCLSDEE